MSFRFGNGRRVDVMHHGDHGFPGATWQTASVLGGTSRRLIPAGRLIARVQVDGAGCTSASSESLRNMSECDECYEDD
ncbi:hypothetical protein RRG08_020440 [Elysia crispata]|uniref:Uncharacterized protein n=1 Tax=Elysia crispata TaxID=231223 RepID=A0AAE1B5P7_9GAST|nr:hypothetical protein RRG08_020440 [Elysia crispata]